MFDAAKADRIIGFFERVLRLPDTTGDDGQPRFFLLEAWQKFVIGSLFGWVDSQGLRRFRDAYIEVGKGNGKSPMCAGIGLYGLVADGERAAEIYAAAVTREQARILWTDAQRMVECSRALSSRVDVSVANLACPSTMSFFRSVSSEHRGLDGKRPHMGLLDELHEHPTSMVTTKIRAGAKGRPQPLFVEITNSGVDRTSICWQHHEHSRRVVEGTTEDDRWFAYVCGLDEGDDPLLDPSCWPKANPNLGVSISPDYLERQVATAMNVQGETNTILRLNFCVWTQAISREFAAEAWQACAVTVPDAELLGAPCYAGLDLGLEDDLSAFVLIWALPDGRVVVRPTMWVPRGTLERRHDRPYDAWVRDGALRVTEGTATDYDQVEREVIALCHEHGVREVAYDKRFAEHMRLHFEADGIVCWDTPQGFQLNLSIVRLRQLVSERLLCHGGHPVLAWMADNFVTRKGRDGDVRPDKASAAEKIDGMVALCMAIDRLIRQPEGFRGVLLL